MRNVCNISKYIKIHPEYFPPMYEKCMFTGLGGGAGGMGRGGGGKGLRMKKKASRRK